MALASETHLPSPQTEQPPAGVAGHAVVGSGEVAVGGSGVAAVGSETIPTELHPHKSLTTVARMVQLLLIKAVLPAKPAV